jgi:hypothetical protein
VTTQLNAVMESMDPIVYNLAICSGTLVVALLIVTFVIAATARRLTARRAQALQSWKAQGLQFVLGPAQANFLNERRSFGTNGNGTLLLSTDAVRFVQAAPEREIVIPLDDIDQVTLVNQFNGRWGGGPFLVIQRKVGDLTGFQTEQPQRWNDAIRSALMQAQPALASQV